MDALRSAVLKSRSNRGTEIITRNVDGQPPLNYLATQIKRAASKDPFFLENLLKEVATSYGLKPDGLKSQRRYQTYFFARAEFCYRAFMESNASMPRIGRVLGDRDHTTVRNAIAQHCTLKKVPLPPGVNWAYWIERREAQRG